MEYYEMFFQGQVRGKWGQRICGVIETKRNYRLTFLDGSVRTMKKREFRAMRKRKLDRNK